MIAPDEVSEALVTLKSARCPEAIFGSVVDLISPVYRGWAKTCHEDRVRGARAKAIAHEAFVLLTKLYEQAQDKVAKGTYGDCKPAIMAVLRTKTASYEVTSLLREDPLTNLYDGVAVNSGTPCTIRLCRTPRNNDLLKNEADVVAKVPAALDDTKHAAYFPNLLDSFEVSQGRTKRRANVFSAVEGAVSLAEVRAAYPDGVHVKDAAWMFNRLLEGLHLLHCQGYVHANITPDSVYIVPATHQGFLTDFCYTVPVGEPAKALVPAWSTLYPFEVTNKVPLDFSTDVCMAAHVCNYLLGADIGSTVVPRGTPVAVAGILRACWLGQHHRTSSAKTLYDDFRTVRHGLGWVKEFRPFSLTPVR